MAPVIALSPAIQEQLILDESLHIFALSYVNVVSIVGLIPAL
jgi:hypothetical protein